MLTLVTLLTTAFVPTPRVAPRASAPVMIDGSPMIDYGIATFAGLACTAAIAPLVLVPGILDLDPESNGILNFDGTLNWPTSAEEEEEMCELVDPSSLLGTTALYAEQKDWWTCPGMTLAENCQEVFHEGEYKVACAF